jgi:cytochrome c553
MTQSDRDIPKRTMRTKLMTIVSLERRACYASLLALVVNLILAAPARAQDANTGAVSERQVQAKLAYCEVCHGVAAQGFNGYYPIPRLAGQQIAYIENELQGFVEHKRTNNIMFNVGHVLSPAMIKALATDFHSLNPKPLGGGPKDLVPAGEKIFQQGLADAGVPPCATCHGPEAKGNDQFPRLAGQLYPYLVSQLTNWAKERGETNSNVMAPIAHSLTAPQVKAVAAYLSSLE